MQFCAAEFVHFVVVFADWAEVFRDDGCLIFFAGWADFDEMGLVEEVLFRIVEIEGFGYFFEAALSGG